MMKMRTAGIFPKRVAFRIAVFIGLAVFAIAVGWKAASTFLASRAGRTSVGEAVSNPKTPVPAPGARKKLVFSEELSIGQNEADENTFFGNEVVFNTDGDGNFYVTDSDKKKILKFDPSGKFLQTIGRRGQGPGEFQEASVARFDANGDLYITDSVSLRIFFYDGKGTPLRQIRIPEAFEDLYADSRGRYVANRTVRQGLGAALKWKFEEGFYGADFKLLKEIRSFVFDPEFPTDRQADSMSRYLARMLSRMAYRPLPRHVLAPDGTVFSGSAADYEIDVYSAEGVKRKTVRRAYEPRPVREADKAYFESRTARPFFAGSRRREENIRSIIQLIEYPEFKPAYHSFGVMENGWLVVLVDFEAGESWLFDLFDETGRYIGQFSARFPADTLFFFKNGKAYAVDTDKDGYKHVKRYGVRIEDY